MFFCNEILDCNIDHAFIFIFVQSQEKNLENAKPHNLSLFLNQQLYFDNQEPFICYNS